MGVDHSKAAFCEEMGMRIFALTMLLLGASGASCAAADAVDVPALVAALDSDDFTAREAAQQAIVTHGIDVLENLLQQTPPEKSSPLTIHQQLNGLLGRVKATLERDIYAPLARGKSFEARYRGERIRTELENFQNKRLVEVFAKYPAKLPPDQQERVAGYTGGFRDEGPWFEGTFHNDSHFTVTAILALIRTTHKETGEVIQREVLFTPSDKPIAQGETVNWSADVGMQRTSKHDYFWDITAVYGLPIETPGAAPADAEEEPRLMQLVLPLRR